MSLRDADHVSVYISVCDKVTVSVRLSESLSVVERLWVWYYNSVSLWDADHVSVYIYVVLEQPVDLVDY